MQGKEIEQIKNVYKKRKETIPCERYSFFNKAALFFEMLPKNWTGQ